MCGARGCHERWFRLRDECPQCGFRFERVDGMFVGAIGMNTVVSFGALLAVLVIGIVWTYPDIPLVPMLVAAAGAAIVVPLVFVPASRTLYAAIDVSMRPLTDDEAPRLAAEEPSRQGPGR